MIRRSRGSRGSLRRSATVEYWSSEDAVGDSLGLLKTRRHVSLDGSLNSILEVRKRTTCSLILMGSDIAMIDVLRACAKKLGALQPPQLYGLRRGQEIYSEESSARRLQSRVRPSDVLQLVVLPEVRASRLLAILRSAPDSKMAAFQVRDAVAADALVAEAFVEAGGLIALVTAMQACTSQSNASLYMLQALLAILATRQGMEHCATLAPDLLPLLVEPLLVPHSNPSYSSALLSCLLALMAALPPSLVRELLAQHWADSGASERLVDLAQDANVPTAVSAVRC